jgi:hypothetical protein
MKEEHMKTELFKGTIVKMHRDRETQDSYIEIDDEVRGKVLVKCLGTPLVKAFHKAFGGGVIVDGKFNKDGIAGEKIGYRVDEKGFLSEFTHEASPKTTWFPGGGSYTRRGFLPADHPLFGTGPIVSGRPILEPPKKERFIDRGLAKPDDPIYSTGPIVAGRAILQPYRKMTAEEIEELFQRGRDAIAKGKPTDN